MEKIQAVDIGEETILKLRKLNMLLDKILKEKEYYEKKLSPTPSFDY